MNKGVLFKMTMSTMKVRIGSRVSYELTHTNLCTLGSNELLNKVKHQNYIEWLGKFGVGLLTAYSWGRMGAKAAYAATPEIAKAVASSPAGADQIRKGFQSVIDVITAIAEPILWGYAVVGLVLVATGKKQAGWDRVKSVGWAYLGIAMLPTFFAFLRWVAAMLKATMSFG